ncbi:MAG: DinB family protein [Phaeodactylibacter xiamenensis]|uniref:DinB-like domain-containing protein n=1 Tax=Phaeodactylibacter xiamenensis TaxID=1524460 RepID=A0A098RXY8_9BACT|nr:DinB family protein [Phaeodactylibacter xiamenensis]KGE85049.1 hypothetical protein IX84_30070 [Phaeodactylibacter xiamenensis]
MTLSKNLSKHFKGVLFGGNWSDSNYRDQLSDVDWQMATSKVAGLNTIAQLVYHATYYLPHIASVLEGGPLQARDKYSWETPDIQSEADWQALLDAVWADAERLIAATAKLPEEQMWADFSDPKYGHYFSNLNGIIEHLHYHLGQIVLLKKLLRVRG